MNEKAIENLAVAALTLCAKDIKSQAADETAIREAESCVRRGGIDFWLGLIRCDMTPERFIELALKS